LDSGSFLVCGGEGDFGGLRRPQQIPRRPRLGQLPPVLSDVAIGLLAVVQPKIAISSVSVAPASTHLTAASFRSPCGDSPALITAPRHCRRNQLPSALVEE